MARFLFFVTVLSVLLNTVAAIRKIESTSLNTCMENSALHASYFSVVFTPDNRTLTFKINGDSQVSDHIKLDLEVTGYGWAFFSKVIDPCEGGNGPDNALKGVCPMRAGPLANMRSNAQLPADALQRVPGMFVRCIQREKNYN
jgi:hypothetical protein